VLVCAKANGTTSAQIKPMIVFFTYPLLLMVNVNPKFVTQALNGRSISVCCFDQSWNGDIRIISRCMIERFRRTQ